MRVVRLARYISWKYAVGEVLLIFVGITAALAANSWYMDRQRERDEIRLLEQLRVALVGDLTSFEDVADRLETRIDDLTALRQHLREHAPYDKALDAKFGQMNSYSETNLNLSVYETLRSRGFDLLSSNDLAFELIDLYENQRETIERDNANIREMTTSYWLGPMLSRLEMGIREASPYDYESLLDDREYDNLITLRIVALEGFVLPRYFETIEKIQKLISDIEVELGRLN